MRQEPNRRDFIRISALAGGGMLACWTGGCSTTDEPRRVAGAPYFTLDDQGALEIGIPRTEIGQGVMTGLAQLVVDELRADWASVRVSHALADPDRFGTEQGTVASRSIFDSWHTWREAAAKVRMMLIAAAARRWQAALADCSADGGWIEHTADGRRLSFAQLVQAASQMPVPKQPILLNAFDVVGAPIGRIDSLAKVTGRARFGIDVKPDRAWTAVVIHAPRYGEDVAALRPAEGRQPHVHRIVRIPRKVITIEGRHHDLRGGVAVIADDYWSALQAAQALTIEWTRSRRASSSDRMMSRLSAALDKQAHLAGAEADPGDASYSRTYSAPFLAHATMEPMNCSADVTGRGVHVWAPTQAPKTAQAVAAAVAGVPVTEAVVETTFVGGGFGRRTEVDYVAEAVWLSKILRRPIKAIWPREEDLRQEYFRPAAQMRLSAETDGSRITRWVSRLAAGSSTSDRRGTSGEYDPVDWTSVLGADANPYAPASFKSSYAIVDLGPPTGYMRGVSNGYTCFANESFVDELAARASIDPLQFRLANLQHDPRARAVLTRCASIANWTRVRDEAVQGVALFRESRGPGPDDYNLAVATVVELARADTQWRVARIFIVGDFGRIVNPDLVHAQMEGGAIFGLSAALKGQIDFIDGEPQQTNFHDYPVMRVNEAPEISVDLIASGARPGGVGEKGVPGIAPALANALYRATGRRQRSLPLTLDISSSDRRSAAA